MYAHVCRFWQDTLSIKTCMVGISIAIHNVTYPFSTALWHCNRWKNMISYKGSCDRIVVIHARLTVSKVTNVVLILEWHEMCCSFSCNPLFQEIQSPRQKKVLRLHRHHHNEIKSWFKQWKSPPPRVQLNLMLHNSPRGTCNLCE